MIEYARPRLVTAGGFDVAKGQSTVTDYRKTDICWFQRSENELIQKIESKVMDLTKMPLTNFEGIQYGKYQKGGYYHSHYDFCDPKWGKGAQNFLNRGGQRVITVLIYLNTLPKEVGGETVFMDHNPPLTFRPKQGKALIFYNVYTDIDENQIPHFGACDYSVKHEAVEIKQEGIEKHICTQWIRENTFV